MILFDQYPSAVRIGDVLHEPCRVFCDQNTAIVLGADPAGNVVERVRMAGPILVYPPTRERQLTVIRGGDGTEWHATRKSGCGSCNSPWKRVRPADWLGEKVG